jgi:hypothetical protein
MQNVTTILNEGNTTQAVNLLPITIMQPMDHILNLLCIHSLQHTRKIDKDHISIQFDKDLHSDIKQILAVLQNFGFKISYFNNNQLEKSLYLIVSQSKAILN